MTVKQNKKIEKKKQFKTQQYQTSKSHIYACFEQPQTIEILKYISMPTPNKLLFGSGSKNTTKNTPQQDDKNNSIFKRVKEFRFQRIYNRQEKFRYAFSQEINSIILQLFKGYSQTVFIYGTEESKKDKILIGESQNAGFLLTTLAEMFEYCHEKEIQDQVTIKISCSMFKDGKFTDPFNLSEHHSSNGQSDYPKQQNNQSDPRNQEQEFENLMCEDSIEGKYLLGCPQIIIRNMRTALKIINLITKKIQQRRQLKEQNTQNIIFTIKLQIDTAFDRQSTGQVYEYTIPKLYIVKLGNPSIDNTLNGINKNNKWFINMFNFLQNQVLQEKTFHNRKSTENTSASNELLKAPVKQLTQILLANHSNGSQTQSLTSDQTKDVFTQYIRTVVMKGVADIHCFTSINNKMTSNQCLTAFIFNNYLSAYQTKPQKTVLNIHHLKNQKNNFEEQLMNLFTLRGNERDREIQISDKYRAKYCLQNGMCGSKIKEKVLKSTSNRFFVNQFLQGQKGKSKQGRTGTKIQRQAQSQGLKKQSSSVLNQNQYLDSEAIKQTLRRVISFPSREQQLQTEEIEWYEKIYLLNYIQSMRQLMNCFNLVEYEYAQILSQGCERLNKYIFNEEIEEFYYAKKISLQYTLDLQLALQTLKTQKLKTIQIEDKIFKRITANIKKVNSELQLLKLINARQEHEQLFKTKKTKLMTMVKERELIQKIFEYYQTMSYHYIYEDNPKLLNSLLQTKRKIQLEFEKKIYKQNAINYDEIMKNIKKGFTRRICEKKNLAHGTQQQDTIISQSRQLQSHDQMNDTANPLDHTAKTDNKWLGRSILSGYNNHLNQTNPNPIEEVSQFVCTQKKTLLQDIKEKTAKYNIRKKGDQLDNMFTNSNVGLVRPQFQRKNNK